MDFSVKNLCIIKINGFEIWITETIVNTWIVMAALILFAVVVRLLIKNFKTIPTGFQNVVEVMVEFFDAFFRSTVGDRLMRLGGWFFSVFAFILASNLSGLFVLRPPTADWTTTFALAMSTFILIQAIGLKYTGFGYIKGFFEPTPIFLPLNLIGELARPISLSFRLYGNILAGFILMSLVYALPVYVRLIIPAALHSFFDLFSGALQAYIFCVLSMTFVYAASGIEE